MQRHRSDIQLGRRVHRTPELPAHSFRLAGADLPSRRRAAARSQAQELDPGVAGVDTAGAPRAVDPGTDTGTDTGTGTATFELLRQVRHPHHRGRQLLPRLRSPDGVPEILTEIPTDITDPR